MNNHMTIAAIILAGGSGERFSSSNPKQLVNLAGKPVICHTIEVFENHSDINEIILVVDETNQANVQNLIAENGYGKVSKVVIGGATRQGSSFNGLKACSRSTTHVLIHDAVRPFVDNEIIDRCVSALKHHDAIDVCVDSTDTLVEVDGHGYIASIPKRSNLKRGQTPQAFKYETIFDAHQRSVENGYLESTDDCSLVLRAGLTKVHVVQGSEFNIKITYPIDIHLAEKIFQIRKKNPKLWTKEHFVKELAGKVIVVIGGNSGIGKGICDLARSYGAIAVPLSRSNGMDVRVPQDIERCFKKVVEKHGRIDAVLNTSGVLHIKPLKDMGDDEISEQISINLLGNALVAKYAIPYLSKTRGKLIFFTSSSYTRGREMYATYSATKAGVVNMMQALADELKGTVNVIAINPQRTNTPMRRQNFGEEDESTLLSPEFVALQTLNAMVIEDLTGCVIDVTLLDEIAYSQSNK